MEDCVSAAWHSFKSLTWLWHNVIALTSLWAGRDWCEQRPRPPTQSCPCDTGASASRLEPWIFYPDLTCRTACALCRHGQLEFPSPLSLSLRLSLSLSLSFSLSLPLNDCISKQTPTDHPWCILSSPPCPILVYLPSVLLPLFSPLSFPPSPFVPLSSCRPNAPALFSSPLPDRHYCTETTAPSVIDEQRLMQSPRLRQTKLPSSCLPLTRQRCLHSRFRGAPKVRWGGREEEGGEGEEERPQENTSASQHPCMHLPVPLPPHTHTSSPPASSTPLLCSQPWRGWIYLLSRISGTSS